MLNTNTLRTGSYFRILILCALSIMLVFLGTSVPTASAVTAAEKQAEADEVMKKIDVLQSDLNNANADFAKATTEHEAATAAMDDAQNRVVAAEKRISELQVRLSSRANTMYKNNDTSSFIDVFLGSSSFEEFLTSWDMLEKISSQDASLVQESKNTRAEADAARKEHAAQKEKAASQVAKAKQLKEQIQTTQVSLRDEVAKITAEAAELQAQEDLAAEAAKQAAAAAEAASKSQGSSGGGSTGGGSAGGGYVPGGGGSSSVIGNGQFAHPCPGASLSSDFGYRTFDNSFHNGIDLAAGEGTPYYAAADGTVIIAGYSGSAGNWIVISHGNGMITKYMHSSAIYVSAGQQVSRGQNIGAVGNTGNSFGAHLHFQVEVGASSWSGTPVNPYNYL